MKSDFQKIKSEQIRAFVPEDLQSVERQDVLRTASANDGIVRIRHNPSQSVSTVCFTARFFNAHTDGF